jgi:enoyl-[acyl-carrier protein] reductase I
MQEDVILKEFETIKQEGVQFKSFNSDAFNTDKRNMIIQELKSLFGDNQKIKTMVHSVAKGNLKPMVSDDNIELKHDDFALTIQAMGISLYDWTKAIFEANLFAEDTRIISFTSEGNSKAWQNYAAVSAAKVTLEAITRSIALEFAKYGIKANCIQAGVTDTASLRMIPGSEQIMKYTLKRNPNKRLTLPEDVANAVYLLSKDEASWVTGTIIPVDGGEHLS